MYKRIFTGILICATLLFNLNTSIASAQPKNVTLTAKKSVIDGFSAKYSEHARIATDYKGWIYYINSNAGNSILYKENVNGSNLTIVSDDNILGFCISNDWIYYYKNSTFSSDSFIKNTIYKMKLDGTQKSKIFDCANITSLNVFGNKIIYTESYYNIKTNKESYNIIYSVNTDGRSRSVVNSLSSYPSSGSLYCDSKWMYYLKDLDYNINKLIYKASYDGKKYIKLSNDYVKCMDISGD